MANVVQKKDDESEVVDCAHCGATIFFLLEELRHMSDREPYFGLACPGCGKNIYQDGSILI